jgi:sulfoxide reductase heme-binding subunit YedZ
VTAVATDGGVRAWRAPRWAKPAAFVAACAPMAWAVGAVLSDLFAGTRLLGSEPIKAVEHFTGRWTVAYLLVTLAVTPARRVLGWNWLASWRRMLGLFAFWMAALHVLAWAALDLEFVLGDIGAELIDRWYIVIGMAAFLLLLALAITSTRQWVRRLGTRWATLHRAVYVALVLSLVHFAMAQKRDLRPLVPFAAVAAVLLGWRVRQALSGRR